MPGRHHRQEPSSHSSGDCMTRTSSSKCYQNRHTTGPVGETMLLDRIGDQPGSGSRSGKVLEDDRAAFPPGLIKVEDPYPSTCLEGNAHQRRRGRPTNLAILHRNIRLDDFKVPDEPALPPPSFPQGLELQCRDGFNDMESIPSGKTILLKRGRKRNATARMGQLTFTEGPRLNPKRVKCQRKMPVLDPDLQAANSHRVSPRIDEGAAVKATKATIVLGDHTESVLAADIDPDARTSSHHGGHTVLRSVEVSMHPASIVYQPLRPRQPLELGRTISEDLMMVRAERPSTPAEDDSSIIADTSSSTSSFRLSSPSEGHESNCDDDEDGSEKAHSCERHLASSEPDPRHYPIPLKGIGTVDAVFPLHAVDQTWFHNSSDRLGPGHSNGVEKACKDHRLAVYLQRAGTDIPRVSAHTESYTNRCDNVEFWGAGGLFRDKRVSPMLLRDLSGLPCRKLHSDKFRSFTT